MLRILPDLCPFSGFLNHFCICALFVCPQGKRVFVFDDRSMLNNRNGSVLMKAGMLIAWVSFYYCESEPQPFDKNAIQNP